MTAPAFEEAPDHPVRAAGDRSRLLSGALSAAGDALFILPAFALVFGFLLYPIATSIFRSFYNWSPGYGSPFVGVANYTALAADLAFREILSNEAIYLIGVPICVALPLLIALLLHERVPIAGMVRTIIFFPAIASPVILGIYFRAVLAPAGAFNTLLSTVGLGSLSHNWLGDPALVKPVIIAVNAWATAGIGVVIFSAALSAMEPHLLEAAEVEGASWLQKLRFVILPSLRPVVDLYLALMVLTVFVGLFAWVFVLTAGGPGYASTTLDYDIYQRALTYGQFGLAAAESVYLLGIVAIVLLLAQRLRKLRSRGS